MDSYTLVRVIELLNTTELCAASFMPYRICKIFSAENGHILSKHPGNCRFPHGHTRRIEVAVEADTLDANDMVCDFKLLKNLIQAFVEKFDHAMCINTSDPHFKFYEATYERVIAFENVDPTSELMARMIFEHASLTVGEHFSGERNVRVKSVKIHETETSWAEYSV